MHIDACKDHEDFWLACMQCLCKLEQSLTLLKGKRLHCMSHHEVVKRISHACTQVKASTARQSSIPARESTALAPYPVCQAALSLAAVNYNDLTSGLAA